MGFLLTIAEGKEAGREFVFEQGSVVIGRTSECDVVLYDTGVSRRHARIFSEEDGYSVEDLGSSNGTKVNGVVVQKQRLEDGDAVAVGTVIFTFGALGVGDDDDTRGEDVTGGEEVTGDEDVRDQSTRIVAAKKVLQKPRARAEVLTPIGMSPETVQAMQRHQTTGLEAAAVPRARSVSGGSGGSGGRRGSNPEKAPARDPEGTHLRTRPTGPSRGRRPEAQAAPRLSAAERARIRRENPGPGGSLRIFWLDASAGTQRTILGFAALLLLGLVGLLYWKVLSPDTGGPKLPPEPATLSREPISYSFGLGEGVDYVRPDMKYFEFEFTAPVRAVVLVHFQSRDISEGEVSVTANGVEVGTVPADTLNTAELAHELIVSPQVLKKGEKNQLIFDNVKNPPAKEGWRIWNPWVEIALLPEIPVDQLRREAEDAFARGQQAFERREVGAGNRYEAWRAFRTAWLLLEGHPEPRPELYLLSRDQMRSAQQELDRTCAKLVLEVQRYYNQKDWNAARSTLDHIRDYFPAKDQPCYFKPDEIREMYQL